MTNCFVKESFKILSYISAKIDTKPFNNFMVICDRDLEIEIKKIVCAKPGEAFISIQASSSYMYHSDKALQL